MNIMLLKEGKINVVFDRNDLASHGISYDKLDYKEPVTRKIFKEALDLAKRQVGFCADSGRLYVEAFPCLGGGCVVSFTKLSKDETAAEKITYDYIYEITGSDNFLSAVLLLKKSDSRYYVYKYNESYYFVLSLPFPPLSEYGEEISEPSMTLCALEEAGKRIKI